MTGKVAPGIIALGVDDVIQGCYLRETALECIKHAFYILAALIGFSLRAENHHNHYLAGGGDAHHHISHKTLVPAKVEE